MKSSGELINDNGVVIDVICDFVDNNTVGHISVYQKHPKLVGLIGHQNGSGVFYDVVYDAYMKYLIKKCKFLIDNV